MNPGTFSRYLLPAAAVLLSALALFPALEAGFVNWDDPAYVIDNPLIRDFSFSAIFSTEQVQGTYAPLTLVSYSIDYAIAQLNPAVYHAHNLVLHLINLLLVFALMRKLKVPALAAFALSLLFGLHPMHVESVAWVSGRKDVLYTLWFLTSALLYLQYLEKRKLAWLGLAFLAFGLSVLAKGVAIVLPVVLLLLDWQSKRKLTTSAWIEKLPFLAVSIVFGWIALQSQQAGGAIAESVELPLYDSFFVACRGLTMYMAEAIFPFWMGAWHPYPAGATLTWHYYASALPAALLVVAMVWALRNNRAVAFGLLWFFITLALVLQILPFGAASMADRYTYVPYIGLFYAGYAVLRPMLEKRPKILRVAIGLVAVWLLGLAFLTHLQTNRWYNNETLWTQVIKQYSENYKGWCNRAGSRLQNGDFQLALEDCNQCTELNPTLKESWNNRGLVLLQLGDFEAAVDQFEAALELDENYVRARINLGSALMQLGQYATAETEFSRAIDLDPGNPLPHINRAIAGHQIGKLQQAQSDVEAAARLGESNARAIYERAVRQLEQR